MKKSISYKSIPLELKAMDSGKRTIEGYISKFMNVDAVGDRIFPGAFAKSLKENGPLGKNRIPLCAQHNLERPIGRFLELKADGDGLYFKAYVGTHTEGEDYYRMFKEGIIKEFSIGYINIQTEPNEFGGLDIKELKLMEGSAVTIACNEEALLEGVKSLTPAEKAEKDLEKFDVMIKTLAKKGVEEDNKLILECQAYQLKSLYEELVLSTQVAEEPALKSEPTEEEEHKQLLMELHRQFKN